MVCLFAQGGFTATNPHILRLVEDAIPEIEASHRGENIEFLFNATKTIVREALRQEVSKYPQQEMFPHSSADSVNAGDAAVAVGASGGSSAAGGQTSAPSGKASQPDSTAVARTFGVMRASIREKLEKTVHILLADFSSKAFYSSFAMGLQFIVPPYDPQYHPDIRFVCEESFSDSVDSPSDLYQWKVDMGMDSRLFQADDLLGARKALLAFRVCLRCISVLTNSVSLRIGRPK